MALFSSFFIFYKKAFSKISIFHKAIIRLFSNIRGINKIRKAQNVQKRNT